ncbi:probable replication factor C subunit 1 isoform X2 [Sitodiplosis mosellana]|uniref:probable replication factor C subunit 1 isoform X2 n=1 Tax=Sitodiplosis mosellana TaxID=263140 RepID=UPI0024441724|nr:probable replication factor C subunit 1 isoform X2 [Sitodiplosis mosellana]
MKTRRGKKPATQVSQRAPKIETQDDDVFEDVGRLPKLRPKLKTVKKEQPPSQTKTTCQVTRSRAARNKPLALITNRKSDNTKKHVDKNCNMSSQNSLESNAETVNLIESEGEDIDLDLTPKRKNGSNSNEDNTNPAKRKKPNVFIDITDDEDDDDDDDEAVTEASNANEQTHGDSSGLQYDETASNKSNDEVVSIGATISETGDELEIEAEIELEPTMTEVHEPTEPYVSPDEPNERETDESEPNERESNEREPNEPKEAELEPAEITNEPTESSNEPQENSDDENEQDQENGDDDDYIMMELNPEDTDMFEGVEEDEASSSPALRPKQTTKMSIPRWKQAAVTETPPQKPKIVHTVNRTITMNGEGDAPAKEPASLARAPSSTLTISKTSGELGRQPRVLFKIPHVPKTTNSATNAVASNAVSRDPRMSKDAVPSTAAAPPTMTTATTTTAARVQNHIGTSRAAPLANNTGGQRVSVKERLGNKYAVKSGSSFIIPNDTSAPNSVPASTAAPAQNQQPKLPGLYRNTFRSMQAAAHTQQTPRNIQKPHPDMSAVVREALESKLNAGELKMPEFAAGLQKYEPLFFRLFERTCRVFIQDDCNSTECQFEHKLPDLDIFRKTLDKIGPKRVMEFYDEFICRSQKLFDYYLAEFSKFFGKHSMTAKLTQMVEDCIERKVQFHFMKIVEGFMLTGKPFSKALTDVVQAITSRTMKTQNELIKLVLHTRNDSIRPFVDFLDVVSKQEKFKFSAEWVNRMMFIQREIKLKELSHVIWRIISENIGNMDKYDNDLVTKFMDDYARGP